MAQEPAESKLSDTANSTQESQNVKQSSIYTRSTSLLTWEEIPFATNDEKQGSIQLQQTLKTDHGIDNAPPFEMARYFIGSKCRIGKATQKYIDSLKLQEKHKFDEITDAQLELCFKERMSFSVFGRNMREIYSIHISCFF